MVHNFIFHSDTYTTRKYSKHDSTIFMSSIRKILNGVALLVLLWTKTAVQKALTNFLLLKIKWAFLLFKSTKILL